MRPKRITILVVVLAVMGVLQFAGAVNALLVTLGVVDNPMSGLSQDQPENEMIGAAANSMAALTPAAAAIGVGGSLLFLMCLIGFWRMQKWAVVLFGATVAVSLVVAFVWRPDWVLTHPTKPWVSLILPAVILAVVLPSWRAMSPRSAHPDTTADARRP
jgi:hypothetical protein